MVQISCGKTADVEQRICWRAQGAQGFNIAWKGWQNETISKFEGSQI